SLNDGTFKCDPEDSGLIDYNPQYSQNIYDTALAPSIPLTPLLPRPSAHPPMSEYLPSTFMSTDTSSYLQVRSDESFSDKYPTGSDFLGDTSLEDQMLPSLSEQSYDYGMPYISTTHSLHSTAYAMEPVEEGHSVETENQGFKPFVQDSRPAIYTYRSLVQSTPQQDNTGPAECYKFANPIYMSQEFAGVDDSDNRAKSCEELQTLGESHKGRAAPNSQLNPNAVAIMDEWYRAHLDRPYPNKEEKLQMAMAGDITETQVGSWFANRRNRSNNTRPKQNMKRLRVAIWALCCEYQKMCNGLVNATEMQAKILSLIERHTKF
ncbi:Pre-B-cell leukemia transcription factor 4, partial [Taenia solium]